MVEVAEAINLVAQSRYDDNSRMILEYQRFRPPGWAFDQWLAMCFAALFFCFAMRWVYLGYHPGYAMDPAFEIRVGISLATALLAMAAATRVGPLPFALFVGVWVLTDLYIAEFLNCFLPLGSGMQYQVRTAPLEMRLRNLALVAVAASWALQWIISRHTSRMLPAL